MKHRRLIITVCLPVVVLLVCEGLASLWLQSKPQEPDLYTWRMSKPAPYRYSSYWSPEYVADSFDWKIWHTIDRDGFRTVTDQPINYDNAVYVFGASTVQDPIVPDNLTFTSQLQRLLNSSRSKRYKVLNRGEIATTFTQQSQLIRHTDIKSGDIVILYGGLNDVYAPFNVFANRQKQVWPSTWCATIHDFASHLALSKLICAWSDGVIQSRWNDSSTSVISEVTKNSVQDLLIAERYVTDRHATFILVLQPFLFSHELSDYEHEMLKRTSERGDSLDFINTMTDGWNAVNNIATQAKEHGVVVENMTHLLDKARDDGYALYVDYSHVNEIADSIIAHAMYDIIFPEF